MQLQFGRFESNQQNQSMVNRLKKVVNWFFQFGYGSDFIGYEIFGRLQFEISWIENWLIGFS